MFEPQEKVFMCYDDIAEHLKELRKKSNTSVNKEATKFHIHCNNGGMRLTHAETIKMSEMLEENTRKKTINLRKYFTDF